MQMTASTKRNGLGWQNASQTVATASSIESAKLSVRCTTSACQTSAGATAKAMHVHATNQRLRSCHKSASSSDASAMPRVFAAKNSAGMTMDSDACRVHAISQRPSRTFQLRFVAQSSPSHRPSGPV